jgi:serine/threonine-protein kinase
METSPRRFDQGLITSAKSKLPVEMTQQAAARTRIAVIAFAAMWAFALAMNEGVARLASSGDTSLVWAPWQTAITIIGLAGSLTMLWLTKRFQDRPARLIDIGLIFQILSALLVGILTEPRDDRQAVSWVCLVIVTWPTIAPSTPRKTLVASLLSATAVPVAIFFAHLRRADYDPSVFQLLWLSMPGYICAGLALIPATVIQGLGKQVRKARELGSYRLEDQIGKGGMGEVYRAKHRLLARPAAVKLISADALRGGSDQENSVTIERFRREAEAAATLRSAHTIELYDYGVAEDGTFYYVMEMLDGIDLHDLVMRHGPLPPERVVHLLIQACDSLGEAHQSGLIHRDVKPSNIFICRMGRKVDYVKVLDFGLVKNDVKHPEPQLEITTRGQVSGTPAFMAPEIASQNGTSGAPADVYAIGCVGYWLLTGQYVFTARNAMMMMVQHLQAPPVAPSVRASIEIPADVEQLILKCLEKEPEDRPADAGVLEDLLRKCSIANSWTDERAHEWWSAHALNRE